MFKVIFFFTLFSPLFWFLKKENMLKSLALAREFVIQEGPLGQLVVNNKVSSS